MVVKTTLTRHVCPKCDKTVRNMEILYMDMKNVHQETEYERIDRVTQTVKMFAQQESDEGVIIANRKSFDCSECGTIFESNKEQNGHNQKYHACGLVLTIIKEEDAKPNIV